MHPVATLFAAWAVAVGAEPSGVLPEAAVQGLYEGVLTDAQGEHKIEARVVATGAKAYKVFVRQQRAGDKVATGAKVAKVELDGKTVDRSIHFTGKAGNVAWEARHEGGKIEGACGPGTRLELTRVTRRPPTLGAKPPAGAVVLLDGKSFEEVTKPRLAKGQEQPWKSVGEDAIEVPRGGMNSKRRFASSFKLHVEFKIPLMPSARDQGRGNSGVYLPNGDEIQVLDSFGMTTYKGGGCGGLYAYKDPDTFDQFSLASLPPLQWQTFDVEYRVQTRDGSPAGKPRVTVLHNGITIHDNVELHADARAGGFHFQDHGCPVHYRNIWVLPLLNTPGP